jgi:L,D-transpeptidase YbiS
VDSHARYIYIHGTADQKSIGQPASHGCIHLADADLIPLFDLLPGGTLVWIYEK